MIKSEIRSLVYNALPRIDKTAKYHDRVIDANIEKVLNEMYLEMFALSPHSLQRFIVRYGTTTAITVLLDGTTGVYYSNLPAAIVPVPDKASGVRRVSTMAQGEMMFYPMDRREHDLIRSGTYFATANNLIGYSVNQTRVEYYDMTAAVITAGVIMDLLIPFSVYADTDTVLIPELRDKNGDDLLTRVLKVMGVIQPIDLKDDNSEKPAKAQ